VVDDGAAGGDGYEIAWEGARISSMVSVEMGMRMIIF
jgi:hypothetical protein